MYGLFGTNTVVKNVYRLAAPFLNGTAPKTVADLKPAYIQFLNSKQPAYPVTAARDLIVRDPQQALTLMGAYSASAINDLHQENMVGEFYNGEAQHACNVAAEEALAALGRYNPEAAEVFQLVIHSILMCGSNLNASGLRAHGGTSSKCIGLMWLSMKGGLSVQDIVELLIHEMTHTLVFIDERNKPHFDYDELTHERNWARSSILNRQRPMDKVVHSIVVSHEVLFARANYLPNTEKLGVHPASSVMVSNTLAAIESVNTHPHRDVVCKPRALELINAVRESLLSAIPERISV